MKYIPKLSTLTTLLSIILGFAACDNEQECALYNTDAANRAVFVNASLANITVSPADPTFTVDLVRANADSESSGTIVLTATVDEVPLAGCTVSDYTFAAGENMTKVTVNVSPLEIGKELNITLTLDNTNEPVSGSNTVSVTVNKDYNWVSLGTGTFADVLAFTEKPYDVEIQKADGFDRYRVMKPYEQGLKNAIISNFGLRMALFIIINSLSESIMTEVPQMQFMPTTQVILQESVWQIINS